MYFLMVIAIKAVFLVGWWTLSAWIHWFLYLPLGAKADIDIMLLEFDLSTCHSQLLTNCGMVLDMQNVLHPPIHSW